MLERIIDQDIDETPDDGSGPAIRHGVATDRVVSVVDPEMRHGRKSQASWVDGYKAHVLTDHDHEFVLAVEATAANAPDGPNAAPLVSAAKEVGWTKPASSESGLAGFTGPGSRPLPSVRTTRAGVNVSEVLGDTAYGDGDTRVAVEAVGATVIAKTLLPSPTGKFLKTDFVIDPDAPSATCPAGHTTTTVRCDRDHKRRRVIALRLRSRRECRRRAAW